MSAPATSSAAGPSDQPEVTIVTEVPPSLHKALLLTVKNFYGGEHFLIVYYIMKAVCIREDNLRMKLNYDQKQLRQQLASLRQDKLVKDRNVSQKNENGRTTSTIFYFINYRAIMNVLKYKIDHMRQKLEAKEKEDVQKAMYKCTVCSALYETLDMDRILDVMTGNLMCWRCHGEVSHDESGGPTQVTRSLLARFNEQMLPLYAVILELAGIQLAPHLLEPDITKYMAEAEKESATNIYDQMLDFSSHGGEKSALGAKAFSAHKNAPILKYAHGDQIIVDLNADSNAKVVEETKQVPLWLQDSAIAGEEHAQAAASLSDETQEDAKGEKTIKASASSVTLDMLKELEAEEPAQKRTKVEEKYDEERMEETGAGDEGEGESEDEEDDDEYMMHFKGNRVHVSELHDMVSEMTDAEREEYSRLFSDYASQSHFY